MIESTGVSVACVIFAAGSAESKLRGTGQVVMIAGSAIRRPTRATSAGLNGLFPMPPKICLPSQMARKAPIRQTQSGTPGGRFIASSSPVTAALPSAMVPITGLPASLHHNASAPTQNSMVTTITTSA